MSHDQYGGAHGAPPSEYQGDPMGDLAGALTPGKGPGAQAAGVTRNEQLAAAAVGKLADVLAVELDGAAPPVIPGRPEPSTFDPASTVDLYGRPLKGAALMAAGFEAAEREARK